jgi:hypothetical protein
MSTKFKAGDVVWYIKGGKIGWESWDRDIDFPELIIGKKYEVAKYNSYEEGDELFLKDMIHAHHPDHFELVADEDSEVREITSCINCLYLDENDCEDFFCQKGKDVKPSDINLETIPSNCPMLGKSLTFKW